MFNAGESPYRPPHHRNCRRVFDPAPTPDDLPAFPLDHPDLPQIPRVKIKKFWFNVYEFLKEADRRG